MTYAFDISRTRPGCFLFLLDQSGAMSAAFPEGGGTKSDWATASINRFIAKLCMKSFLSESVILPLFDVGVIGYNQSASSLLKGTDTKNVFLPVSELAQAPLHIEEKVVNMDDGISEYMSYTEKVPCWIVSYSSGAVNRSEAIAFASGALTTWVMDHPHSIPPIVINFTARGSVVSTVEWQQLSTLHTYEGNVLLMNCYVCSDSREVSSFPDTDAAFRDDYDACLLYQGSSTIPETMVQAARQRGLGFTNQTRGFAFNKSMDSIIDLL